MTANKPPRNERLSIARIFDDCAAECPSRHRCLRAAKAWADMGKRFALISGIGVWVWLFRWVELRVSDNNERTQ